MFRYKLQFIGLGQEHKIKTNDIQKTFSEMAEVMKNDVYLGGVEIRLAEGNIEATIRLSPRKLFLFKGNEDSRKFTEDYLMNELGQLKNMVTA